MRTLILIALYSLTFFLPTYHRKIIISDHAFIKNSPKSTIPFSNVIIFSILASIISVFLSKKNSEKSFVFLIYYMQAHLITLIVTDCIKSGVGRFRPDFYARCKPLNNICTGSLYEMDKGRRSFPSGHTSTTTCTTIYMFFKHRNTRERVLLKNVVFASICLMISVVVAVSRVIDKKHFVSDVLVGFMIGAVIGYWFENICRKKIKAL